MREILVVTVAVTGPSIPVPKREIGHEKRIELQDAYQKVDAKFGKTIEQLASEFVSAIEGVELPADCEVAITLNDAWRGRKKSA